MRRPIAFPRRVDVPDRPDRAHVHGAGRRGDAAAGCRAHRGVTRASDRRRFRLEFIATWLILVGGLIVAIARTGRVKPDFIAEWAPFIVGGVSITIFVSVLSIIFATIFAIIGALGRLSRMAPIYAAATLYVSLVRGTPLIIQLIFWYLALPQFGIVLPAIVCGIFGLAFNYGAYMTEIFRAGHPGDPARPDRGRERPLE